jgi:hypothetical protein
MNQENQTAGRQHDIGATGQICTMKAKATSQRVQRSTNSDLGSRVTWPDPGHIGATLFRCKCIHSSEFALNAIIRKTSDSGWMKGSTRSDTTHSAYPGMPRPRRLTAHQHLRRALRLAIRRTSP